MIFEALYEISYETHGYRWREFLDFWEKYEIAEEDTIAHGYNIQRGGKNCEMSEETKKLISEKAKGRKVSAATKLQIKLSWTPEKREIFRNMALGRRHTKESRAKISAWGKGRPKTEAHKAKIKAGQPEKTEEQKQKTRTFNTNTKSKQISQYTPEGVFIKTYVSLTTATKETGINNTGISKCALGKPKHGTAGGFIWKYT